MRMPTKIRAKIESYPDVETLTVFTYPAVYLRTIDGDTVVLSLDLGFHIYHQEHIRLEGVNAPEVYGSHASEAGREAAAFTKGWLEDPAHADLTYWSHHYDEREKYGRSLGYIVATETGACLNDDLTAWLVSKGYPTT